MDNLDLSNSVRFLSPIRIAVKWSHDLADRIATCGNMFTPDGGTAWQRLSIVCGLIQNQGRGGLSGHL